MLGRCSISKPHPQRLLPILTWKQMDTKTESPEFPEDHFHVNTWMNPLDKGLVFYEVYFMKWMRGLASFFGSGHRRGSSFGSRCFSAHLPQSCLLSLDRIFQAVHRSTFLWESVFLLGESRIKHLQFWILSDGSAITLCILQTASPWRFKMKWTWQYLSKHQRGAGWSRKQSWVLF